MNVVKLGVSLEDLDQELVGPTEFVLHLEISGNISGNIPPAFQKYLEYNFSVPDYHGMLDFFIRFKNGEELEGILWSIADGQNYELYERTHPAVSKYLVPIALKIFDLFNVTESRITAVNPHKTILRLIRGTKNLPKKSVVDVFRPYNKKLPYFAKFGFFSETNGKSDIDDNVAFYCKNLNKFLNNQLGMSSALRKGCGGNQTLFDCYQKKANNISIEEGAFFASLLTHRLAKVWNEPANKLWNRRLLNATNLYVDSETKQIKGLLTNKCTYKSKV